MADHPDDAGKAWHDFLEYISRDQEAVVWTWTAYENGQVEDLRKRFGADEAAYGKLRSSLADLKMFVQEHWALPVRSYSIKMVAPCFGFKWTAEDAGGLNSEIWYGEWLRTGDSKLREKLLRYNLDDVTAMEQIYAALRRAPLTVNL